MVLTQKQKTSKNVTQTWYSPLPVVMEIDEISDEWGISKNKLLNLIAVFGLQNKDKLKEALLAEGRDSNQDPHHQTANTYFSTSNGAITESLTTQEDTQEVKVS